MREIHRRPRRDGRDRGLDVINTLTWVNLPHEIVVAAHAVGQWADEHAVSDWMIGQCADRRMVDRLTGERDAAIRERDLAIAELHNIANSRPHEWPEETRNQFQAWAQSRARHAIATIAANPLPEEKDPT
jgi:hypothetical protein